MTSVVLIIIVLLFSATVTMTSSADTDGNVPVSSYPDKTQTHRLRDNRVQRPQQRPTPIKSNNKKTNTNNRNDNNNTGCSESCSECSMFNGCIKCHARHFLFLEWQNMRQLGRCVLDCPRGYYPKIWNPNEERRRRHGKCSRCPIENCERCKNKERCSRCDPPYLQSKGRCVLRCPPSYPLYDADERICRRPKYDRECRPSQWTNWSQCLFKSSAHCIGIKTRSRYYLYYVNYMLDLTPWEASKGNSLKGTQPSADELKKGNSKKYKYSTNIDRKQSTRYKLLKHTKKTFSDKELLNKSINSNWRRASVHQGSNEVIQCPDPDYQYRKCYRRNKVCGKKLMIGVNSTLHLKLKKNTNTEFIGKYS